MARETADEKAAREADEAAAAEAAAREEAAAAEAGDLVRVNVPDDGPITLTRGVDVIGEYEVKGGKVDVDAAHVEAVLASVAGASLT